MTAVAAAHVGAVVVAAGAGNRFAADGGSGARAAAVGSQRAIDDQVATDNQEAALPKQFALLGGKSLVQRAVEAASSVAGEVVVVLPADLLEAALNQPDVARLLSPLVEGGAQLVAGGVTRADSVRAGLAALSDTVTQVVVHDAARPCAPPELFRRVLSALDTNDPARGGAVRGDSVNDHATESGVGGGSKSQGGTEHRVAGAVPGLPPPDTVKQLASGGIVATTLDRNQLILTQTPQAFDRAALEGAYESQGDAAQLHTDCASVVEAAGGLVAVVEGSPLAHKVTTPADLAVLEALLTAPAQQPARGLRVGHGYDIHRRAALQSSIPQAAPSTASEPAAPTGDFPHASPSHGAQLADPSAEPQHAAPPPTPLPSRLDGRPLTLGGVTFEGESPLIGHSDADVPAHALIDAMASGAGLGDIGTLFPDSDPALAGADSIELLTRCSAQLAEAGWRLVHADVTLITDTPRINPHRDEMIANLTTAAGGPVTLSGRSTEGTAIDRIEAHAVALLKAVPPVTAPSVAPLTADTETAS